MGIPSSIYYFLNKVTDQTLFLKRTILSIHILALFSVFIVAINAETITGFLNNKELFDVSFVFVLFILFQIPIKVFEPIMISSKNIMGFVNVNLVFNVLFFFAVAIPIILYSEIIYTYYSMIGFFLLQYIFIYLVIYKQFSSLSSSYDDNGNIINCSLKEQIKYSFPIGASGAISELSRTIDKIIVSGYFNPSQLAIFARGAMEIPMLNVVINSLGNIMMGSFVSSYDKGDIKSILKFWHKSTVIIAFVVYPMMVLMILIADILIPMLFTEKFNGSIVIFQVYTLALLFRVTSYDAIIRAIGKTRALLSITILSLVVNIVLTVVFIELMGLIGAAVATLITVFIVRLRMLSVISQLLEIKIKQVFPWLKLLKILLASVMSIIIVLPVTYIELPLFLKFTLSSVLYGVMYLVLARLLSLLDKDEVDSLNSIVPNKLMFLFGKP